MPRVSQILALLVLIAMISSCAKQNSTGPTGGPEDISPPVVVEAFPPDKTVNFSERSFEVTFDEYFVLDNVGQKLMVSPPFENKPLVKVKKKTLIVSFEEELRDSVTYTFYFLDAIKDLNANNPYDNFQYVFSTGPVLDSLTIIGTIYDASTLEPDEDVFILLYSGQSDTLPQTTIPEYIAKASEEGRFRIDNIAGGTYSIYGLKDLNSNKIYDLPDESFAFIDSTITISAANNYIPPMPDSLSTRQDSARYEEMPGKEYELFSFTGEFNQQYLTASDRKEAYKLNYVFKMPVDSGQFAIEFPDAPDTRILIEESKKKDTITVWLLDSLLYSQQSIKALTSYPLSDSTGGITVLKDTMTFRYMAPKPTRGRTPVQKSALTVTHSGSARPGVKPGHKLALSFDKPIEKIDSSLIKLYMKADTTLLELDYTMSWDTSNYNRLILNHSFIEDSTYTAIWEKSAFTDIFGNVSDSSGVKFSVRSKDSYGTLKMILPGYEGKIILQLLSMNGDVVEERQLDLPEQNEAFFPLLEKGDYMVKAIYDLNADGKWTTGLFESGTQPEPVTFYPSVINIKVQWDLEVNDWEIKEINIKSDALRERNSGR